MKSAVVGKASKQTLLSIACCTGSILCGHVAIITKPSPPFLIRDIVLVLGLLPIFPHSCEIKSGNEASGWYWTLVVFRGHSST